MRKMMKWLNGKKTVIVMLFVIAAQILQQVFIGIWGADAEWIPKLAETFDWFAAALGGVAVTHNIGKRMGTKR